MGSQRVLISSSNLTRVSVSSNELNKIEWPEMCVCFDLMTVLLPSVLIIISWYSQRHSFARLLKMLTVSRLSFEDLKKNLLSF